MISDKDVIDFMPDALSVRHSPLPWWAKHSIVWLACLLLTAVVWASICKVDVIVTAQGKLVSDHPTILMRPMERTVIHEMNVHIGDRVKKGQTLATFDPVLGTADAERLASEIRILKAQFERLSAEHTGTDFVLPPSPAREELWQKTIFDNRKTYYAGRLSYFSSELERIGRTKLQTEQRLASQQKRLALARALEENMAKCFRQGSVSEKEFMEQQSIRYTIDVTVGDDRNQIGVLEAELLSRIAERDSFIADWYANVAEELVKTRENLIVAQKSYEKAIRMAIYTKLEAPEDAMVIDVVPLGVGAGINEAETLMTLAPLGGDVEAEAEVRAEDVGYIRVGDPVRVKIATFPFQQHGTIKGKVRFISGDSFTKGNNELTAVPYFRVRVALEGPEIEGSDLMRRILPGMSAQSEICVEKRRILRYLLNPIIKSLSESVREP